MYDGTNDIIALTEILGRSDSCRWNCVPAGRTHQGDHDRQHHLADAGLLDLPWLDPPSGRTVLTSKTHHADPDKLLFAMIKPRWYPNLVGSAREERYGHRDGCL
jgi:hypothetical protein